ncbi:MAG: FAD-dependent oxidoreductase [Bacteroidetes bacterium]|nr:FAD-dependent oxidoreductase [Bacteroidota bacterium]
MTVEKNISIYICSGCEIGESIDMEALAGIVVKESGIFTCKVHPALCSIQGTEMIRNDISTHSPNAIAICACSPRVKVDVFSFGDRMITERINLRELVAWCQPKWNEDTLMMAADYLRMGLAKIRNSSSPTPYLPEEVNSDLLVVGAGITGITAALEAAKAGYRVILVEKEKEPGGWARKLYRQLPLSHPFLVPEKPVIFQKIDELRSQEKISLLTSAEITGISGQPGMFQVEVNTDSEKLQLKAGAIVAATGWKPYNAAKLTEYNYGIYRNVITNLELEQMAATGHIERPSDGKKVSSIVFIQCAGSRDEKHLPWCSNYCCPTTFKQAAYIREQNKDASVFIIYNDIRMPGVYELFYKKVQEDDGIFITKGSFRSITEKNGILIVTVDQTFLGDRINIETDIVVLATGMEPSGTDCLNLQYRQGKGLPDLKYGFPDSHFICFPYETRRTGIYAAGPVRAPMDIASSMEDACGATLKAIQCIEAVKNGRAVHPRSGDLSYPELYLERCTDCKRCTEECPFGMYDETPKGTPLPNPSRCRRCGIFLGSCPERIINFADYNINCISSMIKAVEIPDEFEEKPRVLIFACENDAYPALDMTGLKRLNYSPYIRIIPVRCIGSVNRIWVSDALSHGFDGILMLGCKPGDDYQCHFIKGSELTETRTENFQETLQTMMLEPERIRIEFVEINDYEKIPQIIDDYIETINEIGANPFKGM